MAIGKKTGGRDFGPGNQANPNGRPRVPDELKRARAMNRTQFETILNKYIQMTGPQINEAIKSGTLPILETVMAKILAKAFNDGDHRRMEFILDRLIGRPKEMPDLPDETFPYHHTKSFTEFCEAAGYPPPYAKQIEMLDFGMSGNEPRLLLGARGFGKSDYVTILGVAYEVYTKGLETSNLIMTKSKTRNAALMLEIASALKNNGVTLAMENSNCIRLPGLIGKDHTVEAITIKTSMRGRHPKRIICDDIVTDEDTSEAMRVLVKKKYTEAYNLCKNIVLIGQPSHAYDLYAELRPLLKKMEVPWGAIPELSSDLEAMKLAGIDESSIEMNYHLKILKTGANPFDNIKYIDTFPTGDSSVCWIDPSFKGTDYTAMTIIKSHFEGIAVVGFTFKKAWNHCLEEMIPNLLKYNVKKLAFECNSLGDQPVIMMRQLLKDKGIGVVGVDSVMNKHSKIMAAGSYAHLIHLCKESSKVYINQVVQYEYKAQHDDAPDSLASCMEWLGLIRGKK